MAETQAKQTALERTKELTDRLEAGIQDLLQSDKYVEYLKSMSQFHRYSTRNTLLIHMQNPGATRVASYKLWDEQFNRHVKKGEKSIRIFAPINPTSEKKLMEKLDPATGKPFLDENGQPVMEEMTAYSRPRFKLVPVFDVSQTYGDPLPELAENLIGNVEQYEAFLDALRDVSPLPVEFESLAENNDGYCRYGEKIGIREGMSEVQTVSAVVHEIAHARLHDKEKAAETPENTESKSKSAKEVEAESISYVVCQHFGIETSPNSFGYLAEWGSEDMAEFKASLDVIRKESNALITAIDERFEQIRKERDIDLSPEADAQKQPVIENERFTVQVFNDINGEYALIHDSATDGFHGRGGLVARYFSVDSANEAAQELNRQHLVGDAEKEADPNTFTTQTRTENIAGVEFTATDIIPEQQEDFEITYWLKGTGTDVLHYFNESDERYGDFETLARIAPDRTIEFVKTDLSNAIKDKINNYAQTAEIPNMAAEIAKDTTSEPPKETRPVGATVLMPLVYNNDGNYERTNKRAKVKIEPPIGKYSVYSRKIKDLDDPYYYLLTDSGRLVSIYSAGRFGGQMPDTVTEESIDTYFSQAKEACEKALQDPETWVDFNHAAIANRLDEAEAHNQPVRESREAARTQKAQERQAQEEAESAAFEEQFNFSVDKIAQGLVNGERVDIVRDRYVDKNPLFALLDRHGVELPLATKGWVNRNLKSVQMENDGVCRMWLPKGIKPSHAFSHAMGELKNKIAASLPPEQTHSDTIMPDTAAEALGQEDDYEITFWNNGEEIEAIHYLNEDNDYETLAFIAYDRSVEFAEIDLPDEIKERIIAFAQTNDRGVSVDNLPTNEVPAATESAKLMPDPSITAAERDSYGYTAEDMLPLRQDKAMELFDVEHTIYMLYDDNTEAMAFDRDEIITFAEMNNGIFGIAKDDWENTAEYAELKAQGNETGHVKSDMDKFAIYQLKDGEDLRYHRFASLNQLENDNLTVDIDNYNHVYAAPLLQDETLDDIFRDFNHAHPHDFTGRSLSVSDVVVIERGGEVTAHYIDNAGFAELPAFLSNEKQAGIDTATEQEKPMAEPVIQTKLSEMLGLDLADSKATPVAETPAPIYRETFEYAYEHEEFDAYHADRNLNVECRNAIDTAINESRYDTNFYKMKDAVKQVVDEYGSERVELLMAKIVQGADWDGRYSRQNKEWAKGFEIPASMKDIYSNTHPILLDGFLNKVREKPSVLETLKVNTEKSRQQSEPKQDNKKSKEMEM